MLLSVVFGARVRISLACLSLVVLAAATPSFAQTASDWTVSNIGSPILAGNAAVQCQSIAACAISVNAAGKDIGGTSDQFTFTYVTFTGDGAFIARVDSLVRTDEWAKAGLMIRESVRPGSKHALALVSPDHGLAFQRRSVTDGSSVLTAGPAGAAPVWLKLERLGATFNTYQSTDGTTWTRFASDTIDMPSTVLAGLAVSSHSPGLRTAARFSGIALTPLLPAAWQAGDIGAQVNGATFYSSQAFLARAAGTDIGGVSDEFRYTFQPVSGDVDVIARVSAIQNVDALTKAGLMVRESLNPAAAQVSVFATPSSGVVFQRRSEASGQSVASNGGALSGAVWLKLERRENRVAAFRSADGVTWTLVGEETLTLPQGIYVGLALASHSAGRTASATFDQVTVRTIPRNAAPTISLTVPASGASANLGASVALAATASDSDGSVAAVDFLIDGTLLSSDASTPYGVTWTPSVAGTFRVNAVARDNAGASTASNAAVVTIEVLAPRLLTFVASPDDATLVDFYQVEFFRSGTSTTGSAVLVRSIGKPGAVAGQISVDVSAILAQLSAGAYVAVVDAVGVGGVGRSYSSPAFTR